MENNLISDDYKDFVVDIKNKIRNSQYEAMKQVNKTLINLYWGIGQEIYNQQQEKGWGKSIVEVLSKELKKEFPDVHGFSSRNLWRMRNLYVEYKDNEFLPPLVAEISWSKNVAIMEKCKDQLEREFYIKMTKKYGWTKDVLINHIENKELKFESPKLEICRMTITSEKEVILWIKLLKSGNLHKLIIVSAFIHV